MDFLIGGIPRGGTTLLGHVSGAHDDSFCYAYESHLAPFLHRFAGDRSVHPSKVPAVVAELQRQTESVLIEMPQWNIARGARASVQFDNAAVTSIVSTAADLMADGSFGSELISKVMAALAQYLPDAGSLGEKTPSNLDVLAKFPAVVPRSCVAVREPFASIKSMERRANDDTDNYNSVFGRSTVDRIGLYVRNVLQLLTVKHNEQVLVSRYEDVIANFDDEVAKIIGHLNLDVAGSIFDHSGVAAVKANIERVQSARNGVSADGFSPWDRWLISATTSGLLAGLGYDVQIDQPQQRPAEVPLVSQVNVLYGAYKPEPSGAQWIEDDAALLIMTPTARASSLRLSVWTDCARYLDLRETDGIIAGGLREPAVRLRHSSFAGGLLQIELPLGTATKLGTAWGVDLHAIRLQSTFSMVSAAVEGLGRDMRRRSALLQEVEVVHD